MADTKFYIPVAESYSGPSLHTSPHGARYYMSEESAKAWRKRHGHEHNWSILEIVIPDDGFPPEVRFCD